MSTTNTKKTSVLRTVEASTSEFGGVYSVRLGADDYDRLIRALEREDRLRRAAYDYLGGKNPNFSEALGRTITAPEAIRELKGLMTGPVLSSDYVLERVHKLLERVQ